MDDVLARLKVFGTQPEGSAHSSKKVKRIKATAKTTKEQWIVFFTSLVFFHIIVILHV